MHVYVPTHPSKEKKSKQKLQVKTGLDAKIIKLGSMIVYYILSILYQNMTINELEMVHSSYETPFCSEFQTYRIVA